MTTTRATARASFDSLTAVQARDIRVGERFVTRMGPERVTYLIHAIAPTSWGERVFTVTDVSDPAGVAFEVRRGADEWLALAR